MRLCERGGSTPQRRRLSFCGASILSMARRSWAVTASGDFAGLLIPNVWPGSDSVREYRLRRDHPPTENGKPAGKYLSPPGRGNLLYFPVGTDPAWLADPQLPLVITEGEFKSIALKQARVPRTRPEQAALSRRGPFRRLELERHRRQDQRRRRHTHGVKGRFPTCRASSGMTGACSCLRRRSR